MIQKIIKVGNSAGVIIPKKFFKEADWKIEDEIIVEVDAQNSCSNPFLNKKLSI